MNQTLWLQLSGAVAGGLVGGCAGFLANIIRSRLEYRRQRHSVASALVGEMQALCDRLSKQYLVGLDSSIREGTAPRLSNQRFRAERDYMPIFRSLGHSVGYLPAPLPRELAFWYTGFALCLERAHEINDLAHRDEPSCLESARDLMLIQRDDLSYLLAAGAELLERLQRQAVRVMI